MAIVIKADGTRKEVQPKNGTDFSLEELKGFVGGFIEIVWLGDGRIMVVNEEGKLIGLPLNEAASLIYIHSGRIDTIIGDVLVCDESEVK